MKTLQAATARDTRAVPDTGRKPTSEPSAAAARSSDRAETALTASSGYRLADMPIGRRPPDATPPAGPDSRHAEAIPNHTGLPDRLKAGIESLSGLAMDDVRVHFNSPAPAALQAHAYTQGSEIHVGPGQERHLPHEAWHVAQQKQGRVKPTLQMKGKPINDDDALEHEADMMGALAGRIGTAPSATNAGPGAGREGRAAGMAVQASGRVLQRAFIKTTIDGRQVFLDTGDPDRTPWPTLAEAKAYSQANRPAWEARRKASQSAGHLGPALHLPSSTLVPQIHAADSNVLEDDEEQKARRPSSDEDMADVSTMVRPASKPTALEKHTAEIAQLLGTLAAALKEREVQTADKLLKTLENKFDALWKEGIPELTDSEKSQALELYSLASQLMGEKSGPAAAASSQWSPTVVKFVTTRVSHTAEKAEAKADYDDAASAFKATKHAETISSAYREAGGGQPKDADELRSEIENTKAMVLAKFGKPDPKRNIAQYAAFMAEMKTSFAAGVYKLLSKLLSRSPDHRIAVADKLRALAAQTDEDIYDDIGKDLHSEVKAPPAVEARDLDEKHYATGENNDPVPLVFYKSQADYPTSIKPKSKGFPVLEPTVAKELPGYGESAGHPNLFTQIAVGTQFQDNPGHGTARINSTKLRDILKRHYVYNSSTYDIDHVRDLGFGGAEKFSNLWPLAANINRRPINGWRTNYELNFKVKSGAAGYNVMRGAIGTAELTRKHFRIKGFMKASDGYAPPELGKPEAGRK